MVTAPLPPLARTPDEWADVVRTWGGRPFHARQLFRWLHSRGVLAPDQMTDLPRELRTNLSGLELERAFSVVSAQRSADDTRKLLLRLRDGATVETVLIPGVTGGKSDLPSPVPPPLELDADAAAADDDEEDSLAPSNASVRVTQCVSTQVGCAMGCVFCASGVAGLKRHLGADEIVAQVVAGRSHLDAAERLSNVV